MPRHPPAPGTSPARDLYERPGFMIRRAHQIATSIFVEACASLGATPTQYGVLTILQDRDGIDQITLSRRLGLDRSTTSAVLRTLEKAGLVARIVGSDRRRRTLALTRQGCERLAALHDLAATALDQLLQPLTADEALALNGLLRKLTDAHNHQSRVPLISPDAAD